MTIKLQVEEDGTIESVDDELNLMIARPNTSTAAAGMDVISSDRLVEAFKICEKYGAKSIGISCYLPDMDLCSDNFPYINNVKMLMVDFSGKKHSLNLLSNSGLPPEKLVQLELRSLHGLEFDQFNLLEKLKVLDVSCFKKSASWLEHEGIIDLTISKFKEKDLSSLVKMKSLKRLKIVQGSLQSLDGIENLKNLETLHIHSLRSLTSLEALLKSPSLKNLIFESYTKTTDWSFLSEMKQLRQLNLTEAISIEFTKDLPNLIFCYSRKVHDKNREPESVIWDRYRKLNLEDGQPLPGFTPLIDPFE